MPRTVIFAGKAAPGYAMAKLIIRLIHAVAERVRTRSRGPRTARASPSCPTTRSRWPRSIFPACDLSEQISTAGTEASGTGNMKAALNGALTIGTLDGANVEIREEVGAENMFIFGHTAEEIAALRAAGYGPQALDRERPRAAPRDRRDRRAARSTAAPASSGPIVDALRGADRYLLCADFRAYADAQARAAAAYAQPDEWWRMSILNVAGMGKFSSDRTTREYAEEIWDVRPVASG